MGVSASANAISIEKPLLYLVRSFVLIVAYLKASMR